MKGVVMAGGGATRFGRRVEKGILEVGGVPLLERAVTALSTRGIDSVIVAVTGRTPETERLAARLGVEVLMTPGRGYHEDTLELVRLMDRYVSLNVDVPFVSSAHVTALMDRSESRSAAAVVPRTLCIMEPEPRSVAVDADGRPMVWVGLNIVSGDRDTDLVVLDDDILSVNVNDDEGLRMADRLARERNL